MNYALLPPTAHAAVADRVDCEFRSLDVAAHATALAFDAGGHYLAAGYGDGSLLPVLALRRPGFEELHENTRHEEREDEFDTVLDAPDAAAPPPPPRPSSPVEILAPRPGMTRPSSATPPSPQRPRRRRGRRRTAAVTVEL
ncbi:hypothetical protein SO694_0025107 [Aureococcus anophagefferens]|uniref:Anaphase-promoting complex subunit 4 WD40 domain-containing protein n=1 Tax=Aureococcus anophagefferens TaxID=44056 RepID=A0ABR1FIN3_AURAN